mgnify:CR=1 FL=1
MAMIGSVLMMVGSLMGLIGGIIILIHAFKSSVGQGFLCLCIPFYILYYAFARYESEKKKMVLTIWLGGILLQIIGQVIVVATMPAMPY